MMTKRRIRRSILSLILTFAMALSLMPMTVMAAPDDGGDEGTTERTTGLFATDWLNWSENGVPSLGSEGDETAQPASYDIGAAPDGAWLYVEYKAAEDGEPVAVKAEDLVLYPLTDGAAGEAVVEGVSQITYWDNESQTDVACDDGYVNLHFPDVGEYLLCHKDDTEKTQGIKINVDYPWLGVYSAQQLNADNYLPEVTCADGTAEFYLIEHFTLEDGQEFAYGEWTWPEEGDGTFTKSGDGTVPPVIDENFNDGSFNDGTQVSVEKVSGDTAGSRIYKVTVSNMPMGTGRNLHFDAKWDEMSMGFDVNVNNPPRTTGLFATSNVYVPEEGAPSVNEGAELEPYDIGAAICGIALYVEYKASESADAVCVKAADLKLYHKNNDGTAGAEVEGAVSQCSYWVKEGEGEEAQDVERQSQEIVTLSFPDTGDYLLCHKNDTEKTQGITIHVDYPWLGVYSAQTLSKDNLLSEVSCADGSAEFYLIENFTLEDGQEFAYGEWTWPEEGDGVFTPYEDSALPSVSDENFNDGSFNDGTQVSVEKVSGDTAGSRIYKVTVSNMPMGRNWNLLFEAQQGNEYRRWDVNVKNPLRTTGLLVTDSLRWPDEEDPDAPEAPTKHPNAEPSPEELWACIPETYLYAEYKASEDDDADLAKAVDLKLYHKNNDGAAGAEVEDGVSPLTYYDRQQDKDVECGVGYVVLHFPAVGDYLLCHKNDTEKTQGITIHVEYPQLGVYSESEPSSETFKTGAQLVAGETAEFYIIENINEEFESISYGAWNEAGDFVAAAPSDVPQVQDAAIRDRDMVTVEKVGTEAAGHRIYKVTVDVSGIDYEEEIGLAFNGQYIIAQPEEGDDGTRNISCDVRVKRVETGLVGKDDNEQEAEYGSCVEWNYGSQAKIAFGIRNVNGAVTEEQAWSEMTAAIYDRAGNLKVTGVYADENKFTFDLADMEFGVYDIVLKNGNTEFGRMELNCPRFGWYFAGKDKEEYKIGDRLEWEAVWSTSKEKCSHAWNPDVVHEFDAPPSLVYYGAENTQFSLEIKGTENAINPSEKNVLENNECWYTFNADDIFTAANENERGVGVFHARWTEGEGKDSYENERGVHVICLPPRFDKETHEGKAAYSGHFLTKEEYEAGDWDWDGAMGITEPSYWVYGENLQEVLDKLKAKAAASSYKYEYIRISTDVEDKKYSKGPDNQVLDVGSGELKGIILYSDTKRPWASLTIKGSLAGEAKIKMSGKWQNEAELAIGPKLHVLVDYALGINKGEHCMVFPDVLADDTEWTEAADFAVKDGAEVKVLKNLSYGEVDDNGPIPGKATGFTIQCAMSEAEAEDILPTDNIDSDFISSNEKESVAIGVAPSEDEETPAQSVTDVIDFDDKIVNAVVTDSEAKLETKLTINKDETETSNAEAKEAIKEVMQKTENPSSKVPSTAKKIQFIDISLKVVVVKDGAVKKDTEGNDIAQTVTETKSELQISIPLPESLKWTPAATSKAKVIFYNVYRYYDGKAEKLNQIPLFLKENSILTFKTDKFSTYAVEAVENEAQSIKITKQPTKTAYTEGEVFSSAGMELTVTYLDGTVEKTTIYTVDKTAALTAADTEVTVTCMGLTAKLPITVSKKQEPTTEPTTQPTTQPTTEQQPTTEPTTEQQPVKKGETLPADKTDANYAVTKEGTVVNGKVTGAEVEYKKPQNKTAKVTIPDTVTVDGITYKITSIAKNAFKNNKKITTLKVGKNVTTIGANAFYGCTKLKTVTLGSGLTKIGDKAFYKCSAMTKLTIPAKVTEIGKQAFYNCKKLKTITIKSTKLKKVGSKAISGIHKKAVIKVPKSKLTAYKKLFNSKTGFKKGMKITK